MAVIRKARSGCVGWNGGGYKQEEPEKPDFFPEDESDMQTSEPETVKKYLAGDFQGNGAGRPGGSAFYRSQIALLKAIIDGDFGRDDPYTWVDEYGFFSKNRYGFSLNAFPVSMKGRTDGSRSWIEDKVLKAGDRILSFSEYKKEFKVHERSSLGGQCVMVLIMGTVLAERFCDGALLWVL